MLSASLMMVLLLVLATSTTGFHTLPATYRKSPSPSSLSYGSEIDQNGYDDSYHDPAKREERRKLRLARKNAKPEAPKQEVITLKTQEEYLTFLETCATTNSLAVIKFHASWCKSCQSFSRKFTHLSTLSPSSISYASLEFSSNPKLCRSLGVTHLPSVQIYKGKEGKVESFSCSPKRFEKVKVKINEWWSDGSDRRVFKVSKEYDY